MDPDDDVILNGAPRSLGDTQARTLLEWLRDDVGLTGAKYGCGESSCGACSVLVDRTLARACVVKLPEVIGRQVTTIEALADGEDLDPVQRAFLATRAYQCGFCTPGMIMAASALLRAEPHPSDERIRSWMAPNLCRCCTYPRILAAIRLAARPASVDRIEGAPPDTGFELSRSSRVPWDLLPADRRDYFDVLGDGLVVVVPPPAQAPGVWAPSGGAWIHVGPSSVIAFTGKVDVGQGTRQAFSLAVARELDMPVSHIRLVMGDTDVCPFDVGTFGSLAMPTTAAPLRRAAAAARQILARSPGVSPGTRRVEVINAQDQVPLQSGRRLDRVVQEDPTVVTGTLRFPSDLSRPGMLHGKVLHPPQYGARLRSLDVSSAEAMPGVTVVVAGELVGVAAPTAAAADAAIGLIEARWHPVETIDEGGLESHLRSHPVAGEGWGGAFEDDQGDVDEQFRSSAIQVTRTYTAPYIAHAPLETRAALAEWRGDRLTVWTGTQQPFSLRRALAGAFDTSEELTRVVVPNTGGGFGGKHDAEVAITAARLARGAGAPVKLSWTREEEFRWGYFRPAAVIDAQAGATSDGQLTTWEFHNFNAGSAAIRSPYVVPNQRIRYHPADSPLRQGSYRALAATVNNFARESLIDELAHELRIDPLQFRLRHLDDERLADVLQTAADAIGWHDPPAEPGHGLGLAAGFEKGGRLATAALVRVEGRRLEVLQIVTAFDCGEIIDVDSLTNQIEGATVMALGGALLEAVHFDAGRVLNAAFSEYPMPRFPDVPPIEAVLIDRPGEPPAGAGETPLIGVAPALANAIFRATGDRLRALPLLEEVPDTRAGSDHSRDRRLRSPG